MKAQIRTVKTQIKKKIVRLRTWVKNNGKELLKELLKDLIKDLLKLLIIYLISLLLHIFG